MNIYNPVNFTSAVTLFMNSDWGVNSNRDLKFESFVYFKF